MAMSFQNSCYHILAPASEAHEYKKLSKIFDVFLIALIIVNVVAMMLETVPGIPAIWQYELHIIEVVSVLIFTVEYFLRLYGSASAPNRPNHER
ncbi:MAG: ion transporter, partial [Pseudomonadota bacterium]|nr:ion transporter [Pseudomonadota bacterium]